ncbi:MAG: hypothetical protein J6D00_06630 [Christensenellaceae bacterium]|nr:hypothetical protein [Christensenellaceae bacterium]
MRDVGKFRNNMRIILGFLITLFSVLVVFLGYSILTYGESWFATPYNPRLQQTIYSVDMGAVYDVNGQKLAWSVGDERNYDDEKRLRLSTAHVLGDVTGMTIGAQTRFGKYLYGKAQSIGDRVEAVIQGSTGKGSDVYLTIDSELSEYAYKLLDERNGAVVVMNYKTGELLIHTNYPSFDPVSVAEDELIDTALVDRVTMGRYPPGSTMKIITAAAAIDAGIDFEYECTGETLVDNVLIRCAGGSAHGEEDLAKAFTSSCNTYFALLSVKLGEERLLEAAKKFGFNEEFNFSDITLYKSNFELSGKESDLAWAGVGQYKDLVTPLHMTMITSAVANRGLMPEPKLLKAVSTNGSMSHQAVTTVYREVLSANTAEILAGMMERVVRMGTATSAAVENVIVCGKTGTAEYTVDGEIKNHSWFTGYIADEEYPYAISVIVEGAGYGSKYASPLAQKVLNKIVNG